MNLIGKKILASSQDDIRFLRGESVEGSFQRDSSFGKKLTLFFEDNTYLSVDIIQPPDGEHILACLHGRWEERDGFVRIVD